MTDIIRPLGDESIEIKYKDNGDGSYTPYAEVELTVADEVTVDVGTAISEETLESGGTGLLGWLSSIRKSISTTLISILGTTNGAAVITDTAGTLQQYLRGIVKLLVAKITVILDAGESHIGAVGGNGAIVDVTPTLTVHATYVANDYIGTSGVPMTFANCARVNGGTGLIPRCVLVDFALQSVAGELWLFDQAPTPPNDSATWSISDADAAKCIGVIPFSTYYASALNSVSPGTPAAPMFFKCAVGSKDLYGCFVTRGAPAYASGDLTFRLAVIQD